MQTSIEVFLIFKWAISDEIINSLCETRSKLNIFLIYY